MLSEWLDHRLDGSYRGVRLEEPVNAAASLNFGVYCGASPAATKRLYKLNCGERPLLVKRDTPIERIRWL